jgi:purine-nucleoside phosphorylase
MTTAAELDQKIQEAAASAREALGAVPSVAVVAGSGLGAFARRLKDPVSVSYDRLRHFPVSTVVGHAGTLVRGTAGGREVVVMNGRKHLYEGADPQVATLPLRALLSAGVKTVILSNAAGGLNPRFEVGDLMLISDHINWQFRNPLIGQNLDRMGPRFPDMSQPYSRRLMALARESAAEQGITLREGVYWANMGPAYETKAEVQMLRQFADVVGMSTAIEDIVAVHAGAEVLGISVVTNTLVAATGPTTHDEVMETGRVAGERFCSLVEGVLRRLA